MILTYTTTLYNKTICKNYGHFIALTNNIIKQASQIRNFRIKSIL